VKIYEAAYDACAPQARRRSLQQAGFFARMTEDQYLARQALFNATAVVSIAPIEVFLMFGSVGMRCSMLAFLLA
jgi:hypothetical protein